MVPKVLEDPLIAINYKKKDGKIFNDLFAMDNLLQLYSIQLKIYDIF